MKKNSIHILLVSDDKDHTPLILQAFKSNQATVQLHPVKSLQDAESFLSECTPDIAIVDHFLPDGQGLEFLKEGNEAHPYPVIIMTRHGDERMAVRVMKAGAFDYIVKSEVSITHLPRICRGVLREWQLILKHKESEKRDLLFKTIFKASAEGIFVVDADNMQIISVNPAFTRITGYQEEEVLGKNPKMLQSGRQNKAFYRKMWHAIKTKGHWEGEIWNRTKNGRVYPEWLSITGLKNEAKRVVQFSGIFSDITRRKADERQLRIRAYYDPLTSLPNRTLLKERLSQAIKQANRNNRKAALLFLDLDHFKQINDTLGHLAGDTILQKVSENLLSTVREVDTVARTGGDEFLILLTDITDRKEASIVAEKVIHMLSHPFQVKEQDAFLGGSIGITIAPDDGTEEVDLIKNADMALYKAKDKGGHTYCFFSEKMEEKAQARILLEWDLRRALEKEELCIYYQPIIDLNTLETVSLEALIRWEHPQQGLLLPDHFIHLAEESKLITRIGEWILTKACTQMKQWHERYDIDYDISVNVSTRQFKYNGLFQSLSNALKKSGFPPQFLTLEITESLMFDALEEMIKKLKALKSLGIKLSIDDFGTGYSSLSYLSHLPVDHLKIDKSFVENLTNDPNKKTLVEAIVKLGQSMKLKVIAEGIETQEALQHLKSIACDMGQGYYFSKPLSAEAYEKVLGASAG